MELSYYPGCTLHGTSEEYDQSIRAVFDRLSVTLSELKGWTCCGASSAHVLDEKLADLLAARNIVLAEGHGRNLLVPCAACYSRLKFAEKSDALPRLRNHMKQTSAKELSILHVHDLLGSKELLAVLSEKVTRPLSGLKIVPYYGCLTQRPPKVMDAKNYEHPMALDRILQSLGAEVVPWSFKTDCCGGSFSLSRPEVVVKLSGDLMEAASHAGADAFVTDCPMCQANLDSRQQEIEAERKIGKKMPVFFITELIALAMEVEGVGKWLSKHLIDPRPLLEKRGLS